jgi:GntR family transcriptional repressor for pyruvate dehydrogenase complex
VLQIEQMIIDGSLKPGDTLPSERDLAQQVGVSRPSLREAILKLEARGLLQPRRGGGVQVVDVFAPTLTEPLVHLIRQNRDAIFDVFELRHAIEEVAAFYAAQRSTNAELENIRRCFNALGRHHSDDDSVLKYAEADAAFHIAVAEASHNLALVYVMRGLFNLLRSTILFSLERIYKERDSYELIYQQHKAVYEAVMRRDPEAAREAAHLHLSYVVASVNEYETAPRRKAARKSQVLKKAARMARTRH